MSLFHGAGLLEQEFATSRVDVPASARLKPRPTSVSVDADFLSVPRGSFPLRIGIWRRRVDSNHLPAERPSPLAPLVAFLLPRSEPGRSVAPYPERDLNAARETPVSAPQPGRGARAGAGCAPGSPESRQGRGAIGFTAPWRYGRQEVTDGPARITRARHARGEVIVVHTDQRLELTVVAPSGGRKDVGPSRS